MVMTKQTKDVRHKRGDGLRIDDKDRKILRLLAEDANRTFAELSELVFLSPPAVHERVRKLRRNGIIKGTFAILDGASIGCSLLSFLHIKTAEAATRSLFAPLEDHADVEEIHSVAGEYDALLKIRTKDSVELESFIERVHALEGVVDVKCQVVLNSYVERGPKPEIDI